MDLRDARPIGWCLGCARPHTRRECTRDLLTDTVICATTGRPMRLYPRAPVTGPVVEAEPPSGGPDGAE